MTGRPAAFPIAVASGKGGVGKSTISLNLALALRERGARVGILDADFYGPDIPLMVNLKRDAELRQWTLGRNPKFGRERLEPVERFGLKIMSLGFLLAESQQLAMPGALIRFGLQQLIDDVAWGGLDYLVIDLPPGTADLQQNLTELVSLAGAIVVVGPQDVAHLDAKKVVTMLRDAGVRILGGVENMSELVCPHCGEPIQVFPPAASERSIWADGIDRLASIPLDPLVAGVGNGARPLLVGHPESAQAESFRALAARVEAALAV